MKRTVRAVILVFAFGAATAFEFAAEARFQKAESLPKAEQPAGFALGKAGTFHWGIQGDSTAAANSCGGTWISSHGHFLTAIHCLLDTGTKVATVDSAGSVVRSIDEKKLRRSIPIVIGDDRRYDATIAAYGHGFYLTDRSVPAATQDPAASARNFDLGYGSNEDWVILKVGTDSSCLSLADRDPAVGDAVWSIQFPSETDRKDGFDVSNNAMATAYVTEGAVTRGSADDVVVQAELAGIADETRRDSVAEVYAHLMDRPESLPTTLDAVPGSSGSGILTPAGTLAGIVNTVVQGRGDITKYYYSGATLGVSARSIQTRVVARFGQSTSDAVFACASR